MMVEKINVNGVELFKIYEDGFFTYLTAVETDIEGAKALVKSGKAFRAHEMDFWGDRVFHFNYVDEEHIRRIREVLHANGVGWKRSKRIAKELIDCHSTAEDLEGERW